MGVKRSRDTFDRVWSRIVLPRIESICAEGPGVSCPDYHRAKARLWDAYTALNRHYSENYTISGDMLLDRHKVGASYSLAVIASAPLSVDERYRRMLREAETVGEDPGQVSWTCIANGRLALEVGCSVVLAYTRTTIKALGRNDEHELIEKLGNEMVFPDQEEVAHENLQLDLSNYLCMCGNERNYDVPLLGVIYYYLERDTIRERLGGEIFELLQEQRRVRANHAVRVGGGPGDCVGP